MGTSTDQITDRGIDERRTAYPGEADRPAVEERDGTWHIRSLPLVREVLRAGVGETTQAGFASDVVGAGMTMHNPPVLYLDGPGTRPSARRSRATSRR